ncbi:unnamed protein product, partial [Ectocarpus sp. 12 AP-2014]
RHRPDHRGSGGNGGRAADRHGGGGRAPSQRGREDGGAGGRALSSRHKAGSRSVGGPWRGSHPAEQSTVRSSQEGGGERVTTSSSSTAARPKHRRRDRDAKDVAASRPLTAAAGGAPASLAAAAGRPWEEYDSPTDSEVPAPQPRALGVGSTTDANERRHANTKWLKLSTGERPTPQPATLRASTTTGHTGAQDRARGERSESCVRARASGSGRKLSRTKHDRSSSSVNHQHHSHQQQQQQQQQHKPKGASALSFVDPQAEDDSEGPVQMSNLDGLGDLPPPPRQAVVSPSQSAFGLRAYEDEGEDGEGEAPSEAENEGFEDDGED